MEVVGAWLGNWFRGVLIDGIMWNMGTLFSDTNAQISEISVLTGTPPAAWNPGIFSLIQQLTETVILPIAGMILTGIMCYELIHMIIERNNLQEIDTWMFFKWVFKTFVAAVILSNVTNIVMAVFDVSHSVIQNAAGLISGSTDVTQVMLDGIEAQLMEMNTGLLLGLWFQSLFTKLVVPIINVVVFVIAYARMIEIYLLTSLAPIPFATLASKEIGQVGQNYFRSLLAIAFQGFLIMVCLAIYAVLVQTVALGESAFASNWSLFGYTVLLAFMLVKTGSLSKSIFSSH